MKLRAEEKAQWPIKQMLGQHKTTDPSTHSHTYECKNDMPYRCLAWKALCLGIMKNPNGENEWPTQESLPQTNF